MLKLIEIIEFTKGLTLCEYGGDKIKTNLLRNLTKCLIALTLFSHYCTHKGLTL